MYLENVDSSWSIVHNKVLLSPLDIFLREELPNMSYQPAKENIFRVFEKPMSTVRVVILGQDFKKGFCINAVKRGISSSGQSLAKLKCNNFINA